MEASQSLTELQHEAVTKEEAASMIDLWSRMQDSDLAPVLSLHDVKEVLQVSDDEARRLLSSVRRSPVAESRRLIPVVLYALLFVSVVGAAWFALWILSLYVRGSFTYYDVKGAILPAVWAVGWTWFYRRPVGRFLRGTVRKFMRGKA